MSYVDEDNADEAARGFIEYWVGLGAYDSMDDRLREVVRTGMTKLAVEWRRLSNPIGLHPRRFPH